MHGLIKSAWAAVLFGYVGVAHGQQLSLDGEVLRSRYCLEASGLTSLRVELRLSYRNRGPLPVILFRYTPLSGFTLRPRSGERRSADELREAYERRRLFDTSKLDPVRPDPQLFTVISPGGDYEFVLEELRVVLKDAESGFSYLGKDGLLRIEAATWPDLQMPGEDLRTRWRDVGYLSLDRVESSPIAIHIDERPTVARCRDWGAM